MDGIDRFDGSILVPSLDLGIAWGLVSLFRWLDDAHNILIILDLWAFKPSFQIIPAPALREERPKDETL